jgi:transcriptional regulator GlxA family with amidase domain
MDRRIQAALEIMHLSHRNLRMAELAQSVNLSIWHFTHLFKTETSFSPKRYMRNLRMKQAGELLQESFLSVKEIAAKVGLGDRSHFSRDFKIMNGQSPSNYRIRDREKPRPR